MKILVIRNHRLGDILQLTPMVKALKAEHPDGRIWFLTGKDYRELLTGNPGVDRIIPFEEVEIRARLNNDPDRYPWIYNRLHDMCEALKRERFDLVINRQYEEGGVLAALVGGGAVRGGRFVKGRGMVFDDRPSEELYGVIRTDRRANRRNLVDWSCLIAGVEPGMHLMDFHVPVTAQWKADRLISGGDRGGGLTAVQMGAGTPFRRWGESCFSEVIQSLISRGDRVVLLGTENEKDSVRYVMDHTDQGERIVDLVGKTSIKVLGAVLRRCDRLITGDTGTMHLAAAVGTPTLSLFFGTAYPWETGPYGSGHGVLFADLPCAPCLEPESCLVGHRCKEMITPVLVRRALDFMEAIRKGRRDPERWEGDGVELLITRVEPGRGQVLVPANVWLDAGMSLPAGTRDPGKPPAKPDGNSGLPDPETVLEGYYRGDYEAFLGAFAEYLDHVIWAFREGVSRGILSGQVQQEIAGVVDLAGTAGADALKAGDPAALADLVRYELGRVFEIVKNGLGAWPEP